jgi:hypothetical protein
LQEAHVGLGIMGKEGRAAVRAADFAFSKFHYLQKVPVHSDYLTDLLNIIEMNCPSKSVM